jgi:FKBP-type peptidyl-prolyl cis-trans isomerase
MAETTPRWDATRVFILVIVVLFIASSLSLSIAVIWQLVKGDDTNSSKNATTTSQENKLQGTKLQNFTPIPDASVTELQKTDTKIGTGEEVKPGDTVTAHYTGAVASTGIIFQSSHDTGQPIPFSLGGVIKGWQDGVPGMKVGGVRRLIIPAEQAYGASPPQGSGIPANAALVFDIELVKIGQ